MKGNTNILVAFKSIRSVTRYIANVIKPETKEILLIIANSHHTSSVLINN